MIYKQTNNQLNSDNSFCSSTKWSWKPSSNPPLKCLKCLQSPTLWINPSLIWNLTFYVIKAEALADIFADVENKAANDDHGDNNEEDADHDVNGRVVVSVGRGFNIYRTAKKD